MAFMRVVALIVVAIHLFILAFLQYRRQAVSSSRWLDAAVLTSLFACAEYVLEGDYGHGFWMIGLLVIAFAAYGSFVIQDITPTPRQRSSLRLWLGLTSVWFAALTAAAILLDTFIVGQDEWLISIFKNSDLAAWAVVTGSILATCVLLSLTFYQFLKAFLPEIANRALFWVLDTIPVALGILFISSRTNLLVIIGMILLLTGFAGAAYAEKYYRVFDIRSTLTSGLRTVFFVGIAAVSIFAALYLAISTDMTPNAQGLLTISVIALFLAVLYVPARQLIEYLVLQLTRRSTVDPAQATREYSQIVTEVVELDALVAKATATMNRVLQVRQSSIILLNSTHKVKDAVELVVMQANRTGYLSMNSPIYNTLAAKRAPLTQFDLEYAPVYQNVAAEEVTFLRSLNMSAYTPILLENVMIGILACGPKLNNTAYYPRDLDLMAVLAQQTAIAVRNARLFDDLQHLNTSMRSLNRTLKATNEQLGRMDAVKTDFVTIASHELRTPLAQIRGYTDIIEALNEQGMLDPDQTKNLVTNLRKATERTEELISAMLDVSQLDVDAMDLRFNPTSIESVIRMAIEPLTDPMRVRKISLSVRGTRGLPTIQADLQRLVQAFRNIIVNAIKFTPDSGKIEIVASVQRTAEGHDQIMVSISDTGVGIDPKNLEMVFKKFFRAYDPSLHSTGAYKFLGAGPGLGLTIARGVIEGHGGKIWVESPGHDMATFPGSTFHILLPVSTPDTARRVLSFEGDAAAQAITQPEEILTATSGR